MGGVGLSKLGKRLKAAEKALARRDWNRVREFGGIALPLLEKRLGRITDAEAARRPDELFNIVDCWLRMSSVRTNLAPLSSAWDRIKALERQSYPSDLEKRILERLDAAQSRELPSGLSEWRRQLAREAEQRERIRHQEAKERERIRDQEAKECERIRDQEAKERERIREEEREKRRREVQDNEILTLCAALDALDFSRLDEDAAKLLGRLWTACRDWECLSDWAIRRVASLRLLEGTHMQSSDYWDSDDPSDWNRVHTFSTQEIRSRAHEELEGRRREDERRRRAAELVPANPVYKQTCDKCGRMHSKSLRRGVTKHLIVCQCGNLVAIR